MKTKFSLHIGHCFASYNKELKTTYLYHIDNPKIALISEIGKVSKNTLIEKYEGKINLLNNLKTL